MKLHRLDLDLKNDEGVTLGSGHVVLRVPSFKERIEKAKALGIKGEDFDGMAVADKIIDEMGKMIESLEIKAGELVFTDLEEMSYYELFTPFLKECQEVLFNGIPLAKN